ncbi:MULTISPECIES: hypothetical protein [unclassified Sphingopyxis]|uniref:hypothetical protein n=1 Tax=unclassified Sphingopyxis TaxID=2614943 RepID=UPI000ACBA03F|nr:MULTISPECIES: hypothetical protein [unclassified Sphingopyxis]
MPVIAEMDKAADDNAALQAQARRETLLWGAAFVIGTFGVGILNLFVDLGSALSAALFFAAMLLLFPFVRAGERLQRVSGNGSLALLRYNRRFMVASFAYVAALMGAIWLTKIGSYSAPVYVLIAIAPSLPILLMIWTMARLLQEEQDEYLRSQHIRHALVATGFVLAAATIWGFLEQFNVVPHMPSYWVFPAWAIGLGGSQIWSKLRG